MNALTFFGLAGFFVGIVLHGLLLSVVLQRRRGGGLGLLLTGLVTALLLWYSGNFAALTLRQMSIELIGGWLVWVDLLAFIGLSLLPGLLGHTHWVYYRHYYRPGRRESYLFRLLVFLLYVPLLALPAVMSYLLADPALHPLLKLGPFKLPFLLLLAASYGTSGLIQVRILGRSTNEVERGVFRTLLPLFVFIPIYNFFVFAWGGDQIPGWGSVLVQLALLASLLPTFVVANSIYRYQFLQITVERSIASALFILATLALYLIGVRTVGSHLARKLDAPAVLLETIFLAAVLLFFHPLSRWIEHWVGRLFTGQVRKYRQLGDFIQRNSTRLLSQEALKELIETRLSDELAVERLQIHLGQVAETHSPQADTFPLRSGGRDIGYLEVGANASGPQGDKKAGFGLLANEIAVAFERCQLLEERLSMERELAQKSHMETLGRMAATIAHNVKNPLSSMKTLLQLQLETGRLEPEQKQEISMVIGEIDRLARTVTSLLRFSRLEGQSKKSSPEPVDLVSLMESVQTLFRGDLKSRQVTLSIEVSPRMGTLNAPAELIKEVLSNLVSNAIEASRAGGHIRLSALSEGERVILSVEDEGAGIPTEIRPHLFDPFVTTKSQGSGLGLAIVKRRVEQLGGTMEVESPLAGGGTRFSLSVPATAVHTAPEQD